MGRPKRKSSGRAATAVTPKSPQDTLYDSITVASQADLQKGRKAASESLAFPSDDSIHDDVIDEDPRANLFSNPAFAGVYIPAMIGSSVKSHTRKSLPASSTASSVTSSSSVDREKSSEYETPGTSAVVTPANSTFSRVSTNAAIKGKCAGRLTSLSNQMDAKMEVDNDENLALELQQAEYDLKSESDSSSLSSMFSVESDSSAPIAKRKRTNKSALSAASSKRVKSSLSLPNRVAKTVASKAVKSYVNAANEDEPLKVEGVSDSDVDDSFDESESTDDSLGTDSDDDDSVPLQVASITNRLTTYREAARERRRRSRILSERQKLELAHPELATMWKELEASPKIATEKSQQPNSITRLLKGFQLEGLSWMKKQEQTQWKGGLLGDEMGMGKTIQAVSLIMSDYPAKDPTLVLVPPVALMQWTTEIAEYTSGKLKVLVYHGTNTKSKRMTVKELKQYDVIMISYNSLESLYRKETKGWNGKGQNQGSIIKEDSAIHAIHYHRLILDEAHSIKQRTTGVAKACFALKGTYKWCLSGTPVQNRVGEFFSLLRFLEITPFANYFCKQCDCSALHWSMDTRLRCNQCKHRGLDHVSVFNQEILNPLTTGDSDQIRKEALRKLRLLTDRIMLRRMKRDETTSMELPAKEVILHQEFFGEIERDFSSSIMSNTGRVFDTYVSRGVMLNNYANIFGLIMQMRQVADHPDLLLKRTAEEGQNVLVCNICDEPAEEAIRSGCKHEFCRSCVKEYVRTCEGSGVSPDCPKCHIALAIDFDQPDIVQDEESVKKTSIINRIKMENWTSSTKIEMLVYDLWKLRSKKHTTKSIVFSQFTSMLQLIEWRLRRAGFKTVMLDGSMTPVQRQKSIDFFMNNTDVEVFLVSLKAGGVALNLTEASRVFIVDPWWNPAAEWQSADRCHRIGQKRPCVITRLCVEDSVESRIVALQEKKAHMINGTVNNDDVAIERLTPEDMQFLFRGS